MDKKERLKNLHCIGPLSIKGDKPKVCEALSACKMDIGYNNLNSLRQTLQ